MGCGTDCVLSCHAAYMRLRYGKELATSKASFYELVDVDMNGNEVSMSKYRNNVLLLVNVATKWSQAQLNYTELSELVDEFGPKGLKVLLFPCNQFAGQEPGSHEEILDFVEQTFQARDKFEWFEKNDVNGSSTREVYSFLKNQAGNNPTTGKPDIVWNFEKFLVSHDGTDFRRYGPKMPPSKIKGDIESLLGERNKSHATTK